MKKTIYCEVNGIDTMQIQEHNKGSLLKINKSSTVVLDKANTISLVEALLTNVGIEVPEFKSYGVFAIPYDHYNKQFGMIVRADGKLGFPGGKVEVGEDHLDALVREIREEVGYIASKRYMNFLTEDHVRDGFYSKCYIHNVQQAIKGYFEKMNSASHKSESNGYIVFDAKPEVIDQIINMYPLAATVREELVKFREKL